MNIHHLQDRRSDALLPDTEMPTTQLPIWIWVVQAFLGYEWLISGFNKLLNRRFNAQLFTLLQQSAHGRTAGTPRSSGT